MRALTDFDVGQPYSYTRRELVEPDWRRLPGWRAVTAMEWQDPRWQRAHSVRTVEQLQSVFGSLLSGSFYDDLAADQAAFATMSMLVTPHMLNTMAPATSGKAAFTAAFYADPVRRYMLPVKSDRDPEWPSHPCSRRDSLHEAEMWVVEGLTHRYPTKVLAELLSSCPQYCGHCTRMDLIGNSTAQVEKATLSLSSGDRSEQILRYLARTPEVRDVVVSGGDVANMPWHRLELFLMHLLDMDSIRDIRLATKALAGLPQYWLQPKVLEGIGRVARTALQRGVNLAIHTHINHVQSVTPLVAKAARAALQLGIRDVRNQGVLLRGVNDSPQDLLDLCFCLLDEASIMPYYLYMCDMIPHAEHWRLAVWEARELQQAIMGWLPGYATPRVVCDVPYVGKRWVDQVMEYERQTGVSYWTKNYRTVLDRSDPAALTRRYPYYDPISTLPLSGQEWWRSRRARASSA